jgi:succinyl-CoA synthetase beta subunit
MDLYEYQGKQLLARYGVALPRSRLARSPQEAAAAQGELGVPVVIKAQVLSGGRGKAGLVRFAEKKMSARSRPRFSLRRTMENESVPY